MHTYIIVHRRNLPKAGKNGCFNNAGTTPSHSYLKKYGASQSRRREAATVTTMNVSSSRSDDHPAVVAKRRPRLSRRREAASRP